VEQIAARRRWCLSGTPMPTSVEDLHGQLAALQWAPYGGSCFRARLSPLHNGMWLTGHGCRVNGSEQSVLKLLATCSLRHCKDGQSTRIAPHGHARVTIRPSDLLATCVTQASTRTTARPT